MIADHDLIRHAYESVIENCARLGSFSVAVYGDWQADDVVTKQTILAIDDLISFAISARRLAVGCDLVAVAKSSKVCNWRPLISADKVEWLSGPDMTTLWDLWGTIIHSERIDILWQEWQARMLGANSPQDVTEIVTQYAIAGRSGLRAFPPKLELRSDRSFVILEIQEILSTFDAEILIQAIETCRKNGLHLEYANVS